MVATGRLEQYIAKKWNFTHTAQAKALSVITGWEFSSPAGGASKFYDNFDK